MISGKINDVTFRLDLPPHMHLHPVFHVSLLEPYTTRSISGRLTSPRLQSKFPMALSMKLLPFSTPRSSATNYIIWLTGWVIHLMIEHGSRPRIFIMPPTWLLHFTTNIPISQVRNLVFRLVELVVEKGG